MFFSTLSSSFWFDSSDAKPFHFHIFSSFICLAPFYRDTYQDVVIAGRRCSRRGKRPSSGFQGFPVNGAVSVSFNADFLLFWSCCQSLLYIMTKKPILWVVSWRAFIPPPQQRNRTWGFHVPQTGRLRSHIWRISRPQLQKRFHCGFLSSTHPAGKERRFWWCLQI